MFLAANPGLVIILGIIILIIVIIFASSFKIVPQAMLTLLND